jgi:serine/threonine protein phosphatase 1
MVLGDLFDRGDEANLVYDFLYKLHQENKATILLGNHDTFLIEFLEGQFAKAAFNAQWNGFGKTIEQFAHMPLDLDRLEEMQQRIMQQYPDLLKWLKSFPYYIEKEDYIFVHGGVDGGKLDWRSMSSPHDFIWSREIELPRVPGKTVVAGHHRTAMIRVKTRNYHLLHLHSPDSFDILYEDGKILIDRFVEVSKEMNVLTLELKA